FLKFNDPAKAFNAFKNEDGEFFRGDLNLFVYTPTGTALLNGIQTNLIWQNFSQTKDEAGKPIISDLIAQAQAGGGWLEYKSRNAIRRVFVHTVNLAGQIAHEEGEEKGKQATFIIGCGYY